MNEGADHNTNDPAAERPAAEPLAGRRSLQSATILQVLPALGVSGGVERGTVEIAQAIVEAGGRSLVVSSGGARVHELKRVGAEHVELPVQSKNPWTKHKIKTNSKLL